MKLVITKELDPLDFWEWKENGDLVEMNDERIVKYLQEDVIDLLDGASWEIER